MITNILQTGPEQQAFEVAANDQDREVKAMINFTSQKSFAKKSE